MGIQDIVQFFRPETFLIAAVLWCLGKFLKKAPEMPDWAIPFVLLVVGLVLAPIYILLIMETAYTVGAAIVSGLIQGLFAASMAVFGNETLKQALVCRKEDKNE